MLESLFRNFFLGVIIGFFFLNVYWVINDFTTDAVSQLEYLDARVELKETSFSTFETKGSGGVVVCEPRLLNNVPGVVCVAQESVLND